MSCLMMPGGHSRGKLNIRFSLKTMALALTMSSCLVLGPIATVPALATDAEVAQADPETAALRLALEEAQTEIERLTGVAEFSRVQYAATKNKLQSTVLQLEALAKVRGDGVYEAAKLRANLEVARGEIERLTAQLVGIEEGGRAEKDAADGLAQVRAQLKARIEELRRVTETAQASASEAKQLRVVLAATGEKVKSLQTKLTAAEALEAGQDKLHSNLLKAKAQITSLTAVAATTQTEFKSVQSKVKAAAISAAQLDKQNKGLLAKLAAAEKVRDEGIQSLARIRTAKAEQDKMFAKVNDQLKEVRVDSGRVQSELEKAQAKHATVIDQLAIAGRERDAFDDQLRLAKQETKKLAAEHQAKLVALRNTAIEQDKALGKASDDLKTAKLGADALATNLKGKEAELKQAQTQVAQLTEQAVTAGEDLSLLEGKLQSAGSEAEALLKQKNVALAELVTIKQDRDEAVQNLNTIEAAKVEQGETLQETSAALQKSVKEVVELESQLKTVNDKTAKLRADLDESAKIASKVADLETELNSSELRVAELIKAHESSRSKVETLGSELQAVSVKMGDLVADKKDILSEVESLKANLTTAEAEAGQKQAALDELTRTKLNLNNTVKMLSILQAAKSSQDEALQKASESILAGKAETSQLSASLKTANDKIVLLDGKLKEADAVAADVVVMRTNLQKAGQRIEDLTAAKQSSLEKLLKLEAELETSQSRSEAIEEQRQAAQTEIAGIRNKLATLNKEIEKRENNIAKLAEAQKAERKEAESNLARVEALANSTNAELKQARMATEQSTLQIQRLKDKLTGQQKELEETSARAETTHAELSSTRIQISERIQKMIAVAVAAPSAEFIELQKKFQALANENEKLKTELLQKSGTAASQ